MKLNTIQDIRNAFVNLYLTDNKVGNTIELIGTSFLANEPSIFGKPNEEYMYAELQWYLSMSRNVNDICKWYHKVPDIWRKVADKDGMINSNYGWAIFSKDNGDQYENVLMKLRKDPTSRQAVMLYNRPSMHTDANANGMSDFMCCLANHFFIRDKKLHCIVQFRSNDAVFGYINDYYWIRYVFDRLFIELHTNMDITQGDIIWQANSLHIYERHYNLIKNYNEHI